MQTEKQNEIDELSARLFNLIVEQNNIELNFENYNVDLQYNIMPKKEGILFHTIKIKVPEHMITVNKKGEIIIKDTITPKAKQISKTNKKPAIQIIPNNDNKVEIVNAGSIVDTKTGKSPVVEVQKKVIKEDIHYKLGKRKVKEQVENVKKVKKIEKYTNKIDRKEPINTIEELEELNKLVEDICDEVFVDGFVFYDEIKPNLLLLQKLHSGIKRKLKTDPLYWKTKLLKNGIEESIKRLSDPYSLYKPEDFLEMAKTMKFLVDKNEFGYLMGLKFYNIVNGDDIEEIDELIKIKNKYEKTLVLNPKNHPLVSEQILRDDINQFLKNHTKT